MINLFKKKTLRQNIVDLIGVENDWFISNNKCGGTYKVTILSEFGKIRISNKSFIRDGSGNYEELIIVNSININSKSELKKLLKQLNII